MRLEATAPATNRIHYKKFNTTPLVQEAGLHETQATEVYR
jgi:hypothetical protein